MKQKLLKIVQVREATHSFSGQTTKVDPPYTNGLVVHVTFFYSLISLKRILTIFFAQKGQI